MAVTTLNVEGMSCGHCKASVERSLNKLNGITNVAVDLEEKKVTVSYDESAVDLTAIKQAITGEGYTVVE